MKFPSSHYYASPHISIPEPIPRAIASRESVESHCGD